MERLIVSGRNQWLQVLCKPGLFGKVGREDFLCNWNYCLDTPLPLSLFLSLSLSHTHTHTHSTSCLLPSPPSLFSNNFIKLFSLHKRDEKYVITKTKPSGQKSRFLISSINAKIVGPGIILDGMPVECYQNG